MSLRRAGHARRAGRAVAVAAVVALAAGCTSGTPEDDPTTAPTSSSAQETVGDASDDAGRRVAVVIPPSDIVAPAEGAALARAAEALADDPPQGVAEVRVVRASTPAFVGDLANLAVDDGFDVVCVVGTGTAELALELARARRATRICTTDGRIAGGPVNLVAVAVDPAALVEAGAVAIGTAPAPVGLLVSPQVGDVEALTAAFTSGVAPPRQAPPSPPASTGGSETASPAAPVSPASSASAPPVASPRAAFVTAAPGSGAVAQENAARELAAEQPSRALVLATPAGAATARAAGASGAELVVVSDWVVDSEGQLPANLLVAMTVDWSALLDGAIEAATTPDTAQVQLRGVDAGVLGALPGQAPEAAAAADRTAEHLRRSAG